MNLSFISRDRKLHKNKENKQSPLKFIFKSEKIPINIDLS